MTKNFARRKKQWAKQWKPKINVLDMDVIELNKKYTFSLSKRSRIGSLVKDVRDYLIILKSISAYVKYEMFPEISPKGRLHYHGTIMFTSWRDVFDFYYLEIPIVSEQSSLEIDTIKDIDKWKVYYLKQQHFKYIYKEKLLPYRLHNLGKDKDTQKCV